MENNRFQDTGHRATKNSDPWGVAKNEERPVNTPYLRPGASRVQCKEYNNEPSRLRELETELRE